MIHIDTYDVRNALAFRNTASLLCLHIRIIGVKLTGVSFLCLGLCCWLSAQATFHGTGGSIDVWMVRAERHGALLQHYLMERRRATSDFMTPDQGESG